MRAEARAGGAARLVSGRRSAARRLGVDRRRTVALLCIILTALNIYLPTGILIGIMITQNLGALHDPILIRIILVVGLDRSVVRQGLRARSITDVPYFLKCKYKL